MSEQNKTINISSLEKLQELKNAIVLFKNKVGKEIEVVDTLIRKTIGDYEKQQKQQNETISNSLKELNSEKELFKKGSHENKKDVPEAAKELKNQEKKYSERESGINAEKGKNKKLGDNFENFKSTYLKPYNRELVIVKEKIGGQSNSSIKLLENLMEKVAAYLDVQLIKSDNSANGVYNEIISLDRKNESPSGGFSGGRPILNYKKKLSIGFTPHYMENRMVDGKNVICLYKSGSPDDALGSFQINKENGQHGYLLNLSLPENPSYGNNDYSNAFNQIELAAKENGVKLFESSVLASQAEFYKNAGYEIDTSSSIGNSNNKTDNMVVVKKKL